jgi:thiosulfate/3-mercaptopyruvate sulfurtransferase
VQSTNAEIGQSKDIKVSTRVPFQHIDAANAETLISSGNIIILDVREADSFERGHIDGAKNATIANLFNILDGVARDRSILVYCYHGYASQEFGQLLSDFCYTNVYSLNGGYEAWINRADTLAG